VHCTPPFPLSFISAPENFRRETAREEGSNEIASSKSEIEGTGLEYWEILHGQLVDKSAAVYQIIYNFINSYSGNTATARLSVAFAPKCME